MFGVLFGIAMFRVALALLEEIGVRLDQPGGFLMAIADRAAQDGYALVPRLTGNLVAATLAPPA